MPDSAFFARQRWFVFRAQQRRRARRIRRLLDSAAMNVGVLNAHMAYARQFGHYDGTVAVMHDYTEYTLRWCERVRRMLRGTRRVR